MITISRFILSLQRTLEADPLCESHFSKFTAPRFRVSVTTDIESGTMRPEDSRLMDFDNQEIGRYIVADVANSDVGSTHSHSSQSDTDTLTADRQSEVSSARHTPPDLSAAADLHVPRSEPCRLTVGIVLVAFFSIRTDFGQS